MITSGLGSSTPAAGLIAGSALGGYLIGLLLLVPLVDRVAPATLVGTQLTVLAAALAVAALAPSLPVFVAAFVVVGAAATTAAQLSAIASRHAAPGRRSVAVSAVSAGISAGILFSRFLGGGLSEALGWRGMLASLAVLSLLTAVTARLVLPAGRPVPARGPVPAGDPVPARPAPGGGYFALLRDLPAVLRLDRGLRLATTLGALWFAAFNLVWVDLTLHLTASPEHLSPGQVGLLSLVGAVGLAVTRVAGVLADRHGPRVVIGGSLLASTAGGALLIAGGANLVITAVGLAVFDAGCFAAQVANQSRVLALDPPRAGRMNSLYLLLYYASGSLAAAAAPVLLTTTTWMTCAIAATGLVATAAAISTADAHRGAAT
jgi:predicted MFS family arabinose efflux permease